MPDPNFAQLLASLLLALLTGTWQPASAEMTAAAPQPVLFSATWHPLGEPGNERDLYVLAGDGRELAGATSSAVSPAHN